MFVSVDVHELSHSSPPESEGMALGGVCHFGLASSVCGVEWGHPSHPTSHQGDQDPSGTRQVLGPLCGGDSSTSAHSSWPT